MTRRLLLSVPLLAAAPKTFGAWRDPPVKPVTVPVRIVIDTHAALRSEQTARFWNRLWPQAARDLASGGVHVETHVGDGEVRRSAGGRPIFVGLDRTVLNLVITGQIPMLWDRARALSGVTTRVEGFHICLVALNYAHGHQVPYLSVNTCLHEILHALLGDIFENRPGGLHGAAREFRTD